MSRYLDHLPVMFREDPFAGRFLLAFEAILTGRDDVEGLEQTIGRSADYIDPVHTGEDFLPWLAGWVALSLRADWDVDTKRGFIREVVPLYRQRGTLAGLRRMLEIYLRPLADQVTREDVVILDGYDTPAHYFQVQLTLGAADGDELRRVQETARAIIDREKPAHTFYALKVVVPTMRLVSEELKEREGGKPERLVLNRNTLLGTRDST
ncbi:MULTISPECIES: phage tail protein [unclassified Solwaraspora]|uniref:phage tail protein n=1 Tax=unclassified Solwaraspora TaxID=2627926 RepID=UPI00248AC7F3|nr:MULTISPECIES: phage tail protein [unclassified Solwaraspora]WBB95246.1 phage tail protein [Solwaraspora sp. WMMA2059]WBC20848.1 phage tail protein [Solwaraspora sp. WMMA2080]WFE21252.1 phage tail protein [Solwaraspora sp. WMMD937]WJK37019.1 phage tail protein [Solwaraspora sp. WMMA2065]